MEKDLLRRDSYLNHVVKILKKARDNEYMHSNEGESFVLAVSGEWGERKDTIR